MYGNQSKQNTNFNNKTEEFILITLQNIILFCKTLVKYNNTANAHHFEL